MMQWEYMLLELPHTRKTEGKVAGERVESVHQITAILNELGEQGWEVVSFSQSFTGAGVHYAPKFLLKRPKT